MINALLVVDVPLAKSVPRLASNRLVVELKVTVPVRGVDSLTSNVPLTKVTPVGSGSLNSTFGASALPELNAVIKYWNVAPPAVTVSVESVLIDVERYNSIECVCISCGVSPTRCFKCRIVSGYVNSVGNVSCRVSSDSRNQLNRGGRS